MLQKKMDEDKAWLRVAAVWKTTVKVVYSDRVRYYRLFNKSGGAFGLCSAIWGMFYDKLITSAVRNRMLDRLEAYAASNRFKDAYYWPCDTLAGKRARIQFCLDQAKLLRAEKRAKAKRSLRLRQRKESKAMLPIYSAGQAKKRRTRRAR